MELRNLQVNFKSTCKNTKNRKHVKERIKSVGKKLPEQ